MTALVGPGVATRRIVRRSSFLALSLSLSAPAVIGASLPVRASAATRGVAPVAPGSQLWAKRYAGKGGVEDRATALSTSPDGSTVFVTGFTGTGGGTYPDDYLTVSYNASTGAKVWTAKYNGPASRNDVARALAVSPDGSRVFVTGKSTGAGTGDDYATVAYDASTGTRLWVKRYNGSAVVGDDSANAVAVSPDGSRVFVTGGAIGSNSYVDYATVAYDASTGGKLWVRTYNGPGNFTDAATAIGVSPDGSNVFVTGYSYNGVTPCCDYATVAYTASIGAKLWAKRYEGPGQGDDVAYALGVSPDSSKVFVTGRSYTGCCGNEAYATIAYKASTGKQLWLQRFGVASPDSCNAEGYALGVSPDGSKVFVTGRSCQSDNAWEDATVAYDASNGGQLWASYFGHPFNAAGHALGVSPDGSKVFITGQVDNPGFGWDYGTVAYDASGGGQLWASFYNGPGNNEDVAAAIGVDPIGDSKVFVAGFSCGAASGSTCLDYDWATIAYRAS